MGVSGSVYLHEHACVGVWNKSVVCWCVRVPLLPSHQSETQQISSSDNASNRGPTLEANQCLNRLGTGTCPPPSFSNFSLPQHSSLRAKNTIKPGATKEEFGKTPPTKFKTFGGFRADRCDGWFNHLHSQWLVVRIISELWEVLEMLSTALINWREWGTETLGSHSYRLQMRMKAERRKWFINHYSAKLVQGVFRHKPCLTALTWGAQKRFQLLQTSISSHSFPTQKISQAHWICSNFQPVLPQGGVAMAPPSGYTQSNMTY